jgi:putative glutamine amidotransferase
MPPLIAITTHPATSPHRASLDGLLDNIVQAVERAGGLPVLIPPVASETTLRGLFERVDGVLLSGGDDLDPLYYGGATNVSVGVDDAARDRLEISLSRWAVERAKPCLGICRGMQVLNVALGGTLYTDISQHPGARRHTYYPGLPFDLRPHEVQIAEDSTLAQIIGSPVLMVNSLHHQACKTVAASLHATACAPDGIVEAIEAPGHPFALAVQWHPEALPDAPEMRALFEALVRASAQPPAHASRGAPACRI